MVVELIVLPSLLKGSITYNLYLYSKDEVGIQELAYLEDPIKEYIYNDAIFRINTVINKNINNKSYFLVATAK